MSFSILYALFLLVRARVEYVKVMKGVGRHSARLSLIICKVLSVACGMREHSSKHAFLLSFDMKGISITMEFLITFSNKLLSLFDMLLLFLLLFALHMKRESESKNRFSQSTEQNESEAF